MAKSETYTPLKFSGEIVGFLDSFEAHERILRKEIMLAFWNSYSNDRLDSISVSEKEKNLYDFFTSKDIGSVAMKMLGSCSDPLLERRLELLLKRYYLVKIECNPAVSRLRNSVEDTLMNLKFSMSDNESNVTKLRKVLKLEENANKRKEAWVLLNRASGSLVASLFKLTEARNAIARELGYRDFLHLKLYIEEIGEEEFFIWLRDFEISSKGSYQKLLEKMAGEFGLEAVAPYDILFCIESASLPYLKDFKETKHMKLLELTMRYLGIDGDELKKVTLYKAESFGGLFIPVDPPNDNRIIFGPVSGYVGYRSFLHEFGHLFHELYKPTSCFGLRNEAGTTFTEGIGEIFAGLLRKDDFLSDVLNSSAKSRHLRRCIFDMELIMARQMVEMLQFESHVYSSGSSDIDTEHLNNQGWGWYRTVYAWIFPFSSLCYLYAMFIASQTRKLLKDRSGPQITEFLKNYYCFPGGAIPWREKIKNGTGKDLDWKYLDNELGSREL